MVSKMHWMPMGLLIALGVGVALAGCATQITNPDNIPNTPATVGASSTVSAAPFGDAANTWSRVEEARAELDTAISAGKLDQVHDTTSRILDLVKTLPRESLMLPEDKRKTLDDHVENIGQLAAMMDKAVDPANIKSVEEHQKAMNDALDMIKGIYPSEALQSSMHMPDMNSASKTMPGDKMAAMGTPADPANESGTADDKMANMSKPADPSKESGTGDEMGGRGKSSDPGKMSGMGMMDKMVPRMGKSPGSGKMAGMGMMDKMMSGMSAVDQSEMKMIMDKMAAMPPAKRKKAMEKMSGMGKPADPNAAPMSGGGMGDM